MSGLPEQLKKASKSPASDIANEPIRTLVVDDDSVFLQLTHSMLSEMGHQVDTAGDGVKAMECVRQCQYDIVVSDLQMPGMDGFALACWIKRRWAHIKVVIMTGQPPTKVNAHMNTRVADGWVFKPFGINDLHDVLHKDQSILQKHR